jgi:hypothetical protein
MKPFVRCVKRKDTELGEDLLSVGDGGEKPVEVFLVDALWEESDNPEEVARVGSELRNVGEASESSMVAARLSL